MDPFEVELPIHYHSMTPFKDSRRGDCCGIKYEGISDGYYCTQCDFFSHKKCSNPPEEVDLPSHTCDEGLSLRYNGWIGARCEVCKEEITGFTLCHYCVTCGIRIHLECAKYPPPNVIDIPQNHAHKLKLERRQRCFTCADCGKDGDGYSYKCHECDLTFHVNCKKYAAEVTHPSHSLHTLKLSYGEPPLYTDGSCRLCGKKLIDGIFYHCSTCNFSLDLHCVFYPPPVSLHELNTHDHKLTLMPKMISFTCTVCGLNGDRSPYVCLPCDFTAHNDCSGYPWVININRHDHRVLRTSLLGIVNSVCGVCRKKMDWTCGGYSCQRCPDSVFHTKCATRKDVWDGLEMKYVPEEDDEDTAPFKKIDENTIQHYSHTEHKLMLDKSGIFNEDRSICEACAYPIYHDSFYSCMSCKFLLHESCANMPTQKRHPLSSRPYYLHEVQYVDYSKCDACGIFFNGFIYHYEYDAFGKGNLDVRCASVPQPFFHQSHPHHPLFYTSPKGVCSACNKKSHHVLRCVEDNCGYVLDFKCALLPYEVKHRVDDHFLSLCYAEDARGKYWCDICEREADPKKLVLHM